MATKKQKTGKAAGRTPETLHIRKDIDNVIKECDGYQTYMLNLGAIGVHMLDTFTSWGITPEDMTDPKNHTKIMDTIDKLCKFRAMIRISIIDLYDFKDSLKKVRQDIKNNKIEDVFDVFANKITPKIEKFSNFGLVAFEIIKPVYVEYKDKLNEVLPKQFISVLDRTFATMSKQVENENINVDTDKAFPEETVDKVDSTEDLVVVSTQEPLSTTIHVDTTTTEDKSST